MSTRILKWLFHISKLEKWGTKSQINSPRFNWDPEAIR